jgi:hypothetical protein
MENAYWKKIDFHSKDEEIRKINLLGCYISDQEKNNIIKAIKMKSALIKSGFFIEHLKKKEFEKLHNYKFSASKGPFTYATSGNNYFMPIFEIYEWIKRSEDFKNEFI